MFIKSLDFLSPQITLYYHGSLSHSSIVSGILSIISIIIIIIFGIFYFLRLIKNEDFNAYYFMTFKDDAGTFPFNASSFFHFISLGENENNQWIEGLDFTKYRIIGFQTYFDKYLNDKNLSKYDHWLYGYCNNKSDTEGISHLIDYNMFEKSACIRKYFNSTEQKYYETGNPKFSWPIMAHGTFRKDLEVYGIIIERCKEETLIPILGEGNICKNVSLKDYSSAYFYFINHYVDVLNYENPNTKFLYRIENGVYKNEYTINNLNINPSTILTHNGLILDNIKEEKAYIYERNEPSTVNTKDEDDLFLAYYFWLKNTMHYYERHYKRIQDVFSSIGGISQVVLIIAVYINSLYNKYITLNDTEKLLFSSPSFKNKIKKKKSEYNFSENKVKELEKQKTHNILPKNNNKKKNIEKANNYIIKDINKGEISLSKSKNDLVKNSDDLNKFNFSIQKTENKDKIIAQKKEGKNKFFDYIIFKLFCEKKYKKFKDYNNFRIKIISEENMIKNHLKIFNILKVLENKRKNKRKEYHLKDLMEFV